MTPATAPPPGRIPLRIESPRRPGEGRPAKAWQGEVITVRATAFKEGHDELGVELHLTSPTGVTTDHRMHKVTKGLDLWQVPVQFDATGEWTLSVSAWVDDWATWRHAAEAKVPAGIDTQLMLATGAVLLHRAEAESPGNKIVTAAFQSLADTSRAPADRLAAAVEDKITAELTSRPLRSHTTHSETLTVRVERARAGVGSWYEFFPRSEGARQNSDGSWKSGTFATASRRLPGIAAMGFDVVYLPPIHPIGTTHRKGPNNSLAAGPHDPGSPWAIGSSVGGHDAIHPDLGTEEDFAGFVGAAAAHNLEIALDLALQCSPDHPWVTEHPEWFTTLLDGSIAYAENPPKKYQDIYPLNFDNDEVGLREEVLRIVLHWVSLGVTIFRVDNPHTKPLRMWAWLLEEVRQRHPEVVFLAEAFTRPAPLHALARIGFQQSYTYFTWRNTKPELEEYLTELAHESSDFLRPNLFVNTPDILTEYLQFGGVPAYKVRAAIAATASPSWGVYSGYELIENVARPGSEENIDNEKYEYKPRDWAKAEASGHSIAGYLRALNRIRSEHPALRQLRNLDVHWSDDEAILVYTKHLDGQFVRSGRSDSVIVVANVDPHATRETTVHLDLTKIGLEPDARFEVTDLLTREKFEWGRDNFVRLDAFTEPVHILRVEPNRNR